MSKRKQLKSYCPKCDHALAGSSIKALTIQVIGGNSSGKTAFVVEFHRQYMEDIKNSGIRSVTTAPEDDFGALERMYYSGKTEKSPSNEVHTYYILHSSKEVTVTVSSFMMSLMRLSLVSNMKKIR